MTNKLCPNCGANPCYHLCHNSPAYYSPEQEREDEKFYGMDDHYERYAAERADAELDSMNQPHYCEFCGKDDTHMMNEGGCPCANGRALPSMTVGAVLKHKKER